MEVKKPQHSSAVDKTYSFKRVQEFVAELKSEIKKITWTSKEELITYTKIVIGATFAFGMSIYMLDLFIQSVLSSLNYLLHIFN